jgi:trans-2,3-dihydro-3-hydroxyanthranilate isomerase
MRNFAFRIVNVFTRGRERLSGNPLCVFEDARGLDDAAMQSLARQFNLSETTFIFPSEKASARVRIYTPSYEMPFAGHPTLGTAYVCRALGLAGNALTLEMRAGVIEVSASAEVFSLRAQPPSWRELDIAKGELAEALGLAAADIADRPLWVKAGKEQLIVPLRDAAAVRRAAPRAGAMGRLKSEDGISMAYVFCLTEPGKALSRFFFPSGASILEDPATGSATANLGGWCIAMTKPLPFHLEISQGEQAGRPSNLVLDIDARQRIFVAGEVLELGRGSIDLD